MDNRPPASLLPYIGCPRGGAGGLEAGKEWREGSPSATHPALRVWVK